MRVFAAAMLVAGAGVLFAAPTASAGSGLLGDLTAPVTGGSDGQSSSDPVANLVAPLIKTTTETATPVTTPVVQAVTTTVAPVVEPVSDTVATVVEPVSEEVAPVVAPIAKTVAPVVAPVTEAVAPVVAPVTKTVAPVVELVAPALEPVRPILDAAQPVLDAAAPVLEPVEPVVGAAVAPYKPGATGGNAASGKPENLRGAPTRTTEGAASRPETPLPTVVTTGVTVAAETESGRTIVATPAFMPPSATTLTGDASPVVRPALPPPRTAQSPVGAVPTGVSTLIVPDTTFAPSHEGAGRASTPRTPRPPAQDGPWSVFGAAASSAGGASTALFAALAAAVLLALPRLGRRLRPTLAPWPRAALQPLLERPG